MNNEIITGNFYDKYNSKNPIYNKLMSNFLSNLFSYIPDNVDDNKLNIFEVGCGEGHLAYELLKTKKNIIYKGVDLDLEIINLAKQNCKNAEFEIASIYELEKYYENKYDFVIVAEVLEHLTEPEKAIKQILKLKTDNYIFSVPNEPTWRILNMMRLKYIKDFGNTPGHLQNWSKNNFHQLLTKYFQIIDIKSVFPWTMALCKKTKQYNGILEKRQFN